MNFINDTSEGLGIKKLPDEKIKFLEEISEILHSVDINELRKKTYYLNTKEFISIQEANNVFSIELNIALKRS